MHNHVKAMLAQITAYRGRVKDVQFRRRWGNNVVFSREVFGEIATDEARTASDKESQVTVQPPSTTSACPVMNDEASEASNNKAPASSLGRPTLLRHVRLFNLCKKGESWGTEFGPE